MATSEEIEKYCRNCVSRDFVNGKGLVCKRTRELPAFEEECESFEKDDFWRSGCGNGFHDRCI